MEELALYYIQRNLKAVLETKDFLETPPSVLKSLLLYLENETDYQLLVSSLKSINQDSLLINDNLLSQHEESPLQISHRPGRKKNIYIMSGANKEDFVEKVFKYNLLRAKWTEVASMHESREFSAVASLYGKIYVAGGTRNISTNSVEVYDPVKNEWEIGPSMNVPRSNFGLYEQTGLLYASKLIIQP